MIGGLIGAAAGGVLGNQADRADDVRQYQYQQQQVQARQSAISLAQVIEMSQSGLSPTVIVNQINSQGVWSRPTANDLIYLKQNGVSDQVIGALQTGRPVDEPSATRAHRETVVERSPVYVEPNLSHDSTWAALLRPLSGLAWTWPWTAIRLSGAHGGIVQFLSNRRSALFAVAFPITLASDTPAVVRL